MLAIQQLAAGRSNAVGVVTLATGARGDVRSPTENCAAGSTPLLTPGAASAAAEIGNGTLFVKRGRERLVHHQATPTPPSPGRTLLYGAPVG